MSLLLVSLSVEIFEGFALKGLISLDPAGRLFSALTQLRAGEALIGEIYLINVSVVLLSAEI